MAINSKDTALARYDWRQSYDWNYEHVPGPVRLKEPAVPGAWSYCGLPVNSPLGIAAGPLLNGRWILYYASLGFDVLTYKTVRSRQRACYPMPNLQPVTAAQIRDSEAALRSRPDMRGSWAVSFGTWDAACLAEGTCIPPFCPAHWFSKEFEDFDWD